MDKYKLPHKKRDSICEMKDLKLHDILFELSRYLLSFLIKSEVHVVILLEDW
jgi:hypothetical protein